MFYTKMSDAHGAFLALVILFPFREKKANFHLCPKYRETGKATRFFHPVDMRPPHDERSLLHMCRCDRCNLPNYPFPTRFIPIELFFPPPANPTPAGVSQIQSCTLPAPFLSREEQKQVLSQRHRRQSNWLRGAFFPLL